MVNKILLTPIYPGVLFSLWCIEVELRKMSLALLKWAGTRLQPREVGYRRLVTRIDTYTRRELSLSCPQESGVSLEKRSCHCKTATGVIKYTTKTYA